VISPPWVVIRKNGSFLGLWKAILACSAQLHTGEQNKDKYLKNDFGPGNESSTLKKSEIVGAFWETIPSTCFLK